MYDGFHIFEIDFFCCTVAVCELVHNVEAILHLP